MVHVEHVVMARLLIHLEDHVPMHLLPILKDNIIQMDIQVDQALSELEMKNQLSQKKLKLRKMTNAVQDKFIMEMSALSVETSPELKKILHCVPMIFV